jgi:hypothetical protein
MVSRAGFSSIVEVTFEFDSECAEITCVPTHPLSLAILCNIGFLADFLRFVIGDVLSLSAYATGMGRSSVLANYGAGVWIPDVELTGGTALDGVLGSILALSSALLATDEKASCLINLSLPLPSSGQ